MLYINVTLVLFHCSKYCHPYQGLNQNNEKGVILGRKQNNLIFNTPFSQKEYDDMYKSRFTKRNEKFPEVVKRWVNIS